MSLETDLAWAAGIIDGEGSVLLMRGVRNKNRTVIFTPHIIVGNSDPDMLVKLKMLFGGSISARRKYQPHHKQQWVWHVSARKALSTAEKLLSYSVTKKSELKALLTFNQMKRRRGGSMNAHGIIDSVLQRSNELKLIQQEQLWKNLKALKHIEKELMQ